MGWLARDTVAGTGRDTLEEEEGTEPVEVYHTFYTCTGRALAGVVRCRAMQCGAVTVIKSGCGQLPVPGLARR